MGVEEGVGCVERTPFCPWILLSPQTKRTSPYHHFRFISVTVVNGAKIEPKEFVQPTSFKNLKKAKKSFPLRKGFCPGRSFPKCRGLTITTNPGCSPNLENKHGLLLFPFLVSYYHFQ